MKEFYQISHNNGHDMKIIIGNNVVYEKCRTGSFCSEGTSYKLIY